MFQVSSFKFQVSSSYRFLGAVPRRLLTKSVGRHLDHRIQSPCYPEVVLPTTSRECGDRELAPGASRNAASPGGGGRTTAPGRSVQSVAFPRSTLEVLSPLSQNVLVSRLSAAITDG